MPLHTVIAMGGHERGRKATSTAIEMAGEEDVEELECLVAAAGLGVWGLLMEPTLRGVMFPVAAPPRAVGGFSCESLAACHLSGTLAVSWRYPPPLLQRQEHGSATSLGPYHSILQRVLPRILPASAGADFNISGWYQVGSRGCRLVSSLRFKSKDHQQRVVVLCELLSG
jgi:hypothetical protein